MPWGSGQLILNEPEIAPDERTPPAYGGVTVTVEVIVPTGVTWNEMNEDPLILFLR